MFKKSLWIVALLAAFAMVFVGCDNGTKPDPGNTGDYPVTHKFVQIPGRSQGWHSIDIKASLPANNNLSKWTDGKKHTITVFLRAAVGIDNDLKFGYAQGAQNQLGGTVTKKGTTDYELTKEFTWAEINNANDIRIADIPGTVKVVSYFEITIVDEDGKTVYKLSEDPDVQGKAHGTPILTEGGLTTTWLKGALGGGSPDPQAIVIDPAASGSFVAVTGITGVPESGIVGANLTLPTEADPAIATNRKITWAITDAGGTGATIGGTNLNVLTTIAMAGTIKIQGTVTNGATASTPWVSKVYEIEITNPSGLVLNNFNDNSTFGYNQTNVAGNQWTLGEGTGGSYDGRAGFDIGSVVAGSSYESVTFTYITDKQARVGFFMDGDRDTTFQGGWQGWIDLSPAANIADEATKTIDIPAGSVINKFAVENKDGGIVTITLVSVMFKLIGGDVVFDLADWLAEQDLGAVTGNLPSPLQKAGSPTVTIVADGIKFSDRTADYFAVDVKINQDGLNLNYADNVYEIVVEGYAAGTDAVKIKLAMPNRPWGNLEGAGAAMTTTGADGNLFSITGTIPAEYNEMNPDGPPATVKEPQPAFRIQTEGAGTAEFTITSIVVTNKGARE